MTNIGLLIWRRTFASNCVKTEAGTKRLATFVSFQTFVLTLLFQSLRIHSAKDTVSFATRKPRFSMRLKESQSEHTGLVRKTLNVCVPSLARQEIRLATRKPTRMQ